MDSFPVLLIVSLMIASVAPFSDEMENEEVVQKMINCMNITNADPERLDAMMVNKNFQKNEPMENMCFFKCAFEELGGMDRNTGKFNTGYLLKGQNENQKQNVKKCLNSCKSITDLCEKAYTMFKCGQLNSVQ